MAGVPVEAARGASLVSVYEGKDALQYRPPHPKRRVRKRRAGRLARSYRKDHVVGRGLAWASVLIWCWASEGSRVVRLRHERAKL